MTEIRFDSIKMPKVAKTKEGYLKGKITVSRCGVFKYRNADGSIRAELRHPDDVLKADSLNSITMIPITLGHPPSMVNATNVELYQVGHTGESYSTDQKNNIIVSGVVSQKKAIENILSGDKVQLSAGYNVDCVKEDGIYEGEAYQYRQTNIQYNHVAIVKEGRAGSEVRFRFDNACESIGIIEDNINNIQFKDSKNMTESRQDAQLRIDALEAEKSALNSAKELVEIKLETAMVKLDHIEKAYNKTKQELDAEKAMRLDSVIDMRVNEKVELLVRSAPYLKDLNAYLSHSSREIMETVINTHNNDSADFSDKDDSYIRGKFDAIVGNSSNNRVDHALAFNVLKKHDDHFSKSSQASANLKMLQEIKRKKNMSN